VGKPYGTKVLDDNEAAVYITGPDGKIIGHTGIARFCKTAEEADAVTQANADMAVRIAASLNACDGMSIEALQAMPRPFNDMLSQSFQDVVAQHDELLAALQQYEAAFDSLFSQCCSNPVKNAWGKQVDMTQLNMAHEAARQALKPVTETRPSYTSITKGGTYERLGAIRGAGQLKGLAGIAYRDVATGGLFIRTPECFAARMKKVEQGEGGAQ